MKRKTYGYKIIVLFVLITILAADMHVIAATQQKYRLRDCLQNDHMYLSKTILSLNVLQNSDKDSFKKEFDNSFVVLSDNLCVSSISKNFKEIEITDSNGSSCIIDTSDSEIKSIVETLNVGDYVVVYGKLSVKGLSNDSYEIIAEHLLVNSSVSFDKDIYVFFKDDEYSGILVDSLIDEGTVKYYIPSTWDSRYVKDVNNNNNISGYQYYLNVIEPINTTFSENFYIFYFEYETYLENPIVDPSDGNIKKIEALIIDNILIGDGEDVSKGDIKIIKDANGSEIHYLGVPYVIGSNSYNLEFVFRPEKNGIVCMLYLYYPNDAYVHHTRDVAYLIETMTVE